MHFIHCCALYKWWATRSVRVKWMDGKQLSKRCAHSSNAPAAASSSGRKRRHQGKKNVVENYQLNCLDFFFIHNSKMKWEPFQNSGMVTSMLCMPTTTTVTFNRSGTWMWQIINRSCAVFGHQRFSLVMGVCNAGGSSSRNDKLYLWAIRRKKTQPHIAK